MLADILAAAIDMGIGQMQFNVTTAERLELAQRDPEHYGNIAVRVSGYSSKFCLLTRELQDRSPNNARTSPISPSTPR